MYPSQSGDFIFQIVPILVGIIFVIVVSIFLIAFIKGISQWNKNNNSPKIEVKVKVVTKRTAVRGGDEVSNYNDYYVTFEMENCERIEFKVKDVDYGMLVEGDQGMLHVQGTRFLGFNRIM